MASRLPCDVAGIAAAGALLRSGRVVAFPTETVYGLGANAWNRDAVLDIFRFKGRPLTDPLIVHVPDAEEAGRLFSLSTARGNRLFQLLSSRFWPGPLTIVARAVSALPSEITAGTGFVGVRVPAHAIAQRLLLAARVPVAAPSANRFGHVSPTRASHVLSDLGSCDITVLLGEEDQGAGDGSAPTQGSDSTLVSTSPTSSCEVGIESTVVKISETPSDVSLVVLRLGGVSISKVRAALREDPELKGTLVEVATTHSSSSAAPTTPAAGSSGGPPSLDETPREGGALAPGQLLTHYAPDLRCFLLTSPPALLGSECLSHPESLGVRPETAVLIQTAFASSAAPEAVVESTSCSPFPRICFPFSGLVILDCGGTCVDLQGRVLAYHELAPGGDFAKARAAIFARLRWAESVPGAQAVLLSDPFLVPGSERDDAEALRDRLFRASSGTTVSLQWRA
jgi:L-threonylcarbamoyladenylate synthase